MQNDETQGNREGWNVQELADEASQKDIDEIQRETLRGDETRQRRQCRPKRNLAGTRRGEKRPQEQGKRQRLIKNSELLCYFGNLKDAYSKGKTNSENFKSIPGFRI
jgi:hypothetical protein